MSKRRQLNGFDAELILLLIEIFDVVEGVDLNDARRTPNIFKLKLFLVKNVVNKTGVQNICAHI